jgi:hypothetical protein
VSTDESLQIIEIIDDETDPFGERSPTVAIDDPGGPRWIAPLAVAVLVGLIGYGVVTSGGGSPKATSITTSSVATLTTSPPTTFDVGASPSVPYYAARPPQGYSVRFAQDQPFPNDFGLIDYQLWATPDASAQTGSWFSATTSPGAPAVYATDAYRLQAGDLSIAVSHTVDEHTVAQFTLPGHTGVTVTSLGWSDDNLVRLASSMQADQSGLEFTDKWFTSDHQLISLAQPWLVVRGLPVEQIVYSSSRDLGDAVAVTIGQSPPGAARPSADDREVALRFLLEGTTPIAADGHPGVAGTVIGASKYSIATWLDGDNIVTVGATVPLPQLITIAQSVHQVPTSVWAGMQDQADQNQADQETTDESPALTVSSGTDANSGPWTVEASVAHVADQQKITWSWGAQTVENAARDTAQITTAVDDKRTYVLADLPRAVAMTAELHVLREGLDPVVVPFLDIDPSLDRTFAAFAFTEPGPFTAQVVAPDGTILASWPSP